MNISRSSVRRTVGNIFRRYSLLYRIYAAYARIRRFGLKKQKNIYNRNIIAFSDLINKLKQEKAIIIGSEIIEKYDTEKKSALLISHELSLSGAPIVLINLAKELMKIGFQVIIMSPRETDDFIKMHDRDYYEVIPFVISDSLFESDLILSSATMFDYIFLNTICTAPLIRKFINTDINVIWWVHESNSLYTAYLAGMMPKVLSDNIKVYAVGSYARKIIEAKYPRYKVNEWMYFCPDISNYTLDIQVLKPVQEKKRIFAHIGSMGWRKGTDVFVDAIYMLPRVMIESCLFVFVGVYLDEIAERKINEIQSRYPDSIIYTGSLSREKMYKLYKEIDYLVCASRDDPMPLVVAEGMCDGVPCICSENTGSADIITKYKAGFVYKGNNSVKLARELKKAFETKEEEYKNLSNNSRIAYEEVYSEEIFERRLKTILRGQAGCFVSPGNNSG